MNRAFNMKIILLIIAFFIMLFIIDILQTQYFNKNYLAIQKNISCIKDIRLNCTNNLDIYLYQKNIDITDARVLLRFIYNATLLNEDPHKITGEIINLVQSAGGKIEEYDDSNINGYIHFTILRDKFDNLRKEINKTTNKKLYFENFMGSNILVEGKYGGMNDYSLLVNFVDNKVNEHELTISQIENNIIKIPSIQNEKDYKDWMTNENNQINYWKSNYVNIDKNDYQFMDKLGVVDGYINIYPISKWIMIKTILPIHPFLIIILLLSVYTIYRLTSLKK